MVNLCQNSSSATNFQNVYIFQRPRWVFVFCIRSTGWNQPITNEWHSFNKNNSLSRHSINFPENILYSIQIYRISFILCKDAMGPFTSHQTPANFERCSTSFASTVDWCLLIWLTTRVGIKLVKRFGFRRNCMLTGSLHCGHCLTKITHIWCLQMLSALTWKLYDSSISRFFLIGKRSASWKTKWMMPFVDLAV